MYHVYMLLTSGGTLYTGQTNNLTRRMKEHGAKANKTAKYLRRFASFKLVYCEKLKTRAEAMKREGEIKKWPRRKKDGLIMNDLDL